MNNADTARAFQLMVEISTLYTHGGDSTLIINKWNELNEIYHRNGGATPTEAQVKELLPKQPPSDQASKSAQSEVKAEAKYGTPTNGTIPNDDDLKSGSRNFQTGDVKIKSNTPGAPAQWAVIKRGDPIPAGFESAGAIA